MVEDPHYSISWCSGRVPAIWLKVVLRGNAIREISNMVLVVLSTKFPIPPAILIKYPVCLIHTVGHMT